MTLERSGRKKYIQNAFGDLLAEKDFEAISIQNIMERAGLNRATFYNHYQDKYELLELTLNEAFTDILSAWIPPDTVIQGPELLRRLMKAVCEWQIEMTKRLNSRRTLSKAMEEAAKQQLYHVIISCLTDVKDFSVQEQRKLERIATMISWSIYGVVVKWSYSQEEPAEAMIEQVLPLLLSNLHALDFMDER